MGRCTFHFLWNLFQCMHNNVCGCCWSMLMKLTQLYKNTTVAKQLGDYKGRSIHACCKACCLPRQTTMPVAMSLCSLCCLFICCLPACLPSLTGKGELETWSPSSINWSLCYKHVACRHLDTFSLPQLHSSLLLSQLVLACVGLTWSAKLPVLAVIGEVMGSDKCHKFSTSPMPM